MALLREDDTAGGSTASLEKILVTMNVVVVAAAAVASEIDMLLRCFEDIRSHIVRSCCNESDGGKIVIEVVTAVEVVIEVERSSSFAALAK